MSILASVFGAKLTLGKLLPVVLPVLEPLIRSIFPGRAGDNMWTQVEQQLQANAGKQIDFATKWLEQDKGEPAWKSAWRPLAMYMCISIITQYLLINPWLWFFFDTGLAIPDLEGIPVQVWYILGGGLGLYIPARSYDKRTKALTEQSRFERQRVEVPVTDMVGDGSRRNVDDYDDGRFTPTPRPVTNHDRERGIEE